MAVVTASIIIQRTVPIAQISPDVNQKIKQTQQTKMALTIQNDVVEQ